LLLKYREGLIVNNYISRGVQRLIREANNNDPLALFELSRIYQEGDFGISADPVEAKRYFQKLQHQAKNLPLKLSHLKLKDFRAFGEFSLDLDKRLTVIIGDNGVGKTTILDAISQCLSWIAARMQTSTGK